MCIVLLNDSLGYNSQNVLMDKANKIYQNIFGSNLSNAWLRGREWYFYCASPGRNIEIISGSLELLTALSVREESQINEKLWSNNLFHYPFAINLS